MQKQRRQRIRTTDLRELEELVWRDLNAVVRAANGRTTDRGAQRPAQAAKDLDHRADGLDRTDDAAEPAPPDTPTPDTAVPQDGPDVPVLAAEAGALELEALGGGEATMEAAAPPAGLPATQGAEWSEGGESHFIDAVADWLHRQPHPDQTLAEIWCRLLALRTPGPGFEAAIGGRRLQ